MSEDAFNTFATWPGRITFGLLIGAIVLMFIFKKPNLPKE